MKNSFYFSHDCNARNDNKLIQLRMNLGMKGYGIYFGIIELLMESNSYQLPLNYQAIAYDLREDVKDIEDVVNNYDLFKVNCTVFYSESLRDRMKKRESLSQIRSAIGKKGAIASKKRQAAKANPDFEKIWSEYPSPIGKKEAQRHYEASIKDEKDKVDIWTALHNYKASKRVQDGFKQNGSTWFNNWRDWLTINTTTDADGIPLAWKTKDNLLKR